MNKKIHTLVDINGNMQINKQLIKEEFKDTFPNFNGGEKAIHNLVVNWWLSKLDEAISQHNEKISRILKQIGTIDTEEDMDKVINLIKNSK